MIIQIRGTSGSGKTTVMRQVMASFAEGWTGIGYPGRKKPLYYSLNNRQVETGLPGVYILGHYEATCGGCDNIGSAAKVFELIATLQQAYGGDSIILCEGLLLSEDSKWTSQMDDVKVLFLNTSEEECLSRVRSRRLAAGNAKELNPDNTVNRLAVIARSRVKLESHGIYCQSASSRQAHRIVLKWIRG